MKMSSIMERLVFIKYISQKAEEQSYAFYPASQLSILMFHDAIELFLVLAYEEVGGTKTTQINFMEYWDLIYGKSKKLVTQKSSISKLNDARIQLKHKGNLVHEVDIEKFRVNAMNFFTENSKLIFNLDFLELSLIDLVNNSLAKRRLKRSYELLNENKLKDSLLASTEAFYTILDEYENKKVGPFGDSPFDFSSSMNHMSSFRLRIKNSKVPEIKEISKFVDTTKKTIESMGNALKIISLGIDYKKYAKFRILTPERVKIESGPSKYYFNQSQMINGIKKEDVEFCIDFVIETALIIQEFDFEVKLPSTDLSSIITVKNNSL
jgi:hypothetical protein